MEVGNGLGWTDDGFAQALNNLHTVLATNPTDPCQYLTILVLASVTSQTQLRRRPKGTRAPSDKNAVLQVLAAMWEDKELWVSSEVHEVASHLCFHDRAPIQPG
jgi:hypothetical protein